MNYVNNHHTEVPTKKVKSIILPEPKKIIEKVEPVILSESSDDVDDLFDSFYL